MENNEKDIFERLENLELVCIILLFELAEKTTSTKDRILQDMIAKAASLGKSIRLLYKEGLYNEGWSLYRILIDRLSHIYQLDKENSYEDFADWSFKFRKAVFDYLTYISSFNEGDDEQYKYHYIIIAKMGEQEIGLCE